jgi:hypothetical protein
MRNQELATIYVLKDVRYERAEALRTTAQGAFSWREVRTLSDHRRYVCGHGIFKHHHILYHLNDSSGASCWRCNQYSHRRGGRRGPASARRQFDLLAICDWHHWHRHARCTGLGWIRSLRCRRGLWTATLEAEPREAVGFYGVIALATLIGLALGYTSLNPIRMLIWSAVLNGIVAVPTMAVMMLLVTRFCTIGRFTARPMLLFLGWTGAMLMAVTVASLFWFSIY